MPAQIAASTHNHFESGTFSSPYWMAQLSSSASAPTLTDRSFGDRLAALTAETFISFARLHDSVSIWAADNRGMQFQLATLPYSTIADTTSDLVALLRNPSNDPDVIWHLSSQLYRALFGPIASFLDPSRRLFVHFAGDLRSIPLAVLRSPGGALLIDQFTFVNATDFPWTNVEHHFGGQVPSQLPSTTLPANARLLIVEAPAVPSTRPYLVDQNIAAPHSCEDLSVIASAIPDNEILGQSAATRAQFDRLARNADLIHCRATLSGGVHGPQLHLAPPSDTDPMSDRSASSDDGVLRLIAYTRLAFSRCWLGVFDVDYASRRLTEPSDLWRAATRALHYAGVRNVVIPRWNVPAQARRDFAHVFYGNLRQGASIEDSCRCAALGLREQAAWRHPHYWAGYTHSITHL